MGKINTTTCKGERDQETARHSGQGQGGLNQSDRQDQVRSPDVPWRMAFRARLIHGHAETFTKLSDQHRPVECSGDCLHLGTKT